QRATPDDPRREKLQAILAAVLVTTGAREEAVQLAERVRAVTGDPGRRAEMAWTLALAFTHLFRNEQARTVLTDALHEPGAGSVWTVRIRALLARVVTIGGDYSQTAAARDALAEAERAGDRIAAAHAANALVGSLHHLGDTAGALGVVERNLAMLG